MNKKTNKIPTLYLVVPCYNEEETLLNSEKILVKKVNDLIKSKIISLKSKILFVNDGSKDKTEEILNKFSNKEKKISIVSFVTNYGHQAAIYAGMMVAKEYADIVVTIDADLQQDINALEDFISKYKEGNDVVYGVRNDRNSDGAIKKATASLYYKIMKYLGCNILPNSADYRLLSKKACDLLSEYKESNLFLRGLIPYIGLNSDVVYFDVKEREFGESKYTFKKMLALAISGITSFSVVPMHLICLLGALLIGISVIMLIINIFTGFNILSVITMFTGLIIGSIGVVGEYIGTINTEVKQRPRYEISYVKINK